MVPVEARRVPIVGQNRATLPDGAVDPEHSTDCGEACLSAVMGFYKGRFLSPGCFRQLILGGVATGETTGPDLADGGRLVGLTAQAETIDAANLRPRLQAAYGVGSLAVILGRFITPDTDHWNVAHVPTDEGVWCMDPWYPARLLRNWASLDTDFAGELVVFRA